MQPETAEEASAKQVPVPSAAAAAPPTEAEFELLKLNSPSVVGDGVVYTGLPVITEWKNEDTLPP